MKTTTLILALLVSFGISALAQDTKGGQTLMESVSREKKEEKKSPVTPAKPTAEILGKRVVLGGYFTDLFKAEKKRPLFSLRTPIDPQKDAENLWYDPGTDKVQADKIQGVVLFSIKF